MKTIILSLLLIASTAFGQTIASKKNYQPPIDLLDNGSFEAGKAGWTQSGGSFAIVTTGSNLLFDKASATFDASSSGQYIQSKLYTVPNGLYGGTCEASIGYLGGDTNLKLVALDGSANVLATRTFESASTMPRPFGITFPCPTSGTFRIRLESLADAAIVAVDKAKLGQFDTFQVATPKLYGSLKSAATASCVWTTTSGSLANFSADTDCPTPTVTGSVTAPGTKVPGLVVEGPGDFLVTMAGAYFQHTSAADGGYSLRLSNGTQNSNVITGQLIDASGFAAVTPNSNYAFTISLPSGSHTLQVQAATINATLNFNNNGNTDGAGLNFQVYKFPTVSETAYRPDTINWLVDANISGANPALGTAAKTSYVEIFDGGITMTQNSGSLGVQIPCETTNASTGFTCSGVNESVGVVFNVPAAGAVEACVEFGAEQTGAASGSTTFQIVETPNNAQTILQEGKSRVNWSKTGGAAAVDFPFHVCGIFNFGTAGQKTLRLMYEQSAQTSTSVILADADSNLGQRDIHWTVKPINQHVPAPVLVGGVTTGATSASLYSVQYNGVAQTMSREYSDWISSIVRNSTGNYTVNFELNAFTNVPNCTATINDNASATVGVFGTTTSSTTVETYVSDVLANEVFNLMCHAQK